MADSWTGKTVACLASGPSLTAEDCDLVFKAGLPVVAVNDTWRIARDCDVIYAGDLQWWAQHAAEIDVEAERWTCSAGAEVYGCFRFPVTGLYNSGQRAIQFAIWRGAAKVILLGYDCSLAAGVHWHGPHEKTKNPDKTRVQVWKGQFGALAESTKERGPRIINCSRATELDCFERADLEEVLGRG